MKAQRNPLSFMAAFARLHVWALRLSKKMMTLSSPDASLNLSSHSMKRSVLTERLNIMNGSKPFFLEMPASTARVGSYNLARSTVGFSFLRLHSTYGNLVLVNMVSSAYTVRYPSFLALVKVRFRLAISSLATSSVCPFGFLNHEYFFYLIPCN